MIFSHPGSGSAKQLFSSLPFLHCWAIYPLSFQSVELANRPPLNTPCPSPTLLILIFISSLLELLFPSLFLIALFFLLFHTFFPSYDEQCRGMETGGPCSPAPRPSVPGCPRRPCDSQRTGRITHKLIQHNAISIFIVYII